MPTVGFANIFSVGDGRRQTAYRGVNWTLKDVNMHHSGDLRLNAIVKMDFGNPTASCVHGVDENDTQHSGKHAHILLSSP